MVGSSGNDHSIVVDSGDRFGCFSLFFHYWFYVSCWDLFLAGTYF
jgi:hypothetical protein